MPVPSTPPLASGPDPGPVDAPELARLVSVRLTATDPARLYVSYRDGGRYVTCCGATGRAAEMQDAARDLGSRHGLVPEPGGNTWRAPSDA